VIAFLLVAVVVIVMPGPDFALTMRNTLMRGAGAGVRTAAGVVAGLLVWEVASIVGVAALIAASQPAFLVVRLLGAAYLVWLGLQALRAAWQRREVRDRRVPGRSAFRQGLFSNLGNPKIAVFFTSLLPQFVTHPSLGSLLLLGTLFNAIGFVWLTVYALAAARGRAVLQRPRVRAWLDAVSGLVLVGLGVRLAVERRG
jgi:threonine/homoserine/homoserine lactone efflux protein